MLEANRDIHRGSCLLPEEPLIAKPEHPNENFLRKVFSPAQIIELDKYLLEIYQRFFGLTALECQRLVQEFAIRSGVSDLFNEAKRLAGEDMILSIFKHFDLRTGEKSGVWVQEEVDIFFMNLHHLLRKHKFTPERIFHVDEICISSVPNDLNKQRFSAEARSKGAAIVENARDNVTLICCASALGKYIPPMIAFPRDRMIPGFLRGLPPGSIGYTSEKGLINTELFLTFLKHFLQHVIPAIEAPVLLLLDNHSSYISIEAMELCKTKNLILLGFPPFTRQKLHPLDISFFGPLKACYSRACDGFSEAYPKVMLTVDNVGEVFRTAYCRTATAANATAGFIASGIEPFQPELHCSRRMLLKMKRLQANEMDKKGTGDDSDVEIVSWTEGSGEPAAVKDALAGSTLGDGDCISCLRCTGLYKIKDWTQCIACRQWWHRACGGFDKAVHCYHCKKSMIAAGM